MNTHPVTMKLNFKEITLTLAKSEWDVYAQSLAGNVQNPNLGVYVYKLSAQNLEKIFKVFDGVRLPKPVVVEGQKFIDQKRVELMEYRARKKKVREIMATERVPIEPNGKFAPYAHQTKMIQSILVDPYLPVMADCGTGKTGTLSRAFEIEIEAGRIQRGKVMVSAPFSILETAWEADITKFTSLSCKILWPTVNNKTLKVGEGVVIGHGLPERPHNAVTVKSKKSSRFVGSRSKRMLSEKPNLFDEAEEQWIKMSVSYKEAVLDNGDKVVVGPITAVPTEKEKTKETWMIDALKNSGADVFLVNHDGVRIYKDILKDHEFEWIGVDESTKIKSMGSLVTKAHVDISWKCKRRTPLTGTPNPNGFMDLWSQFYFADRGLTLGGTIKDFRHEFFTPVKIGHFGGQDAVKWELKDTATRDLLVERVRGSAIFIDQSECLDLPPRQDLVRNVTMTYEQSRIYKKMEEDMVAEFLDKKTDLTIEVEAVNTLARIMKLRQVTSGFMGHAEGIAAIELGDNNPKLKELDDFIEELGDKKLVIACQFTEEIETLLKRYSHLGCAAIYGATSSRASEYVKQFQETDSLRIIILQPKAAAHGITLTKAHYFVFLSLDYNFEYYYQVGKRIQRIGQKNNMYVYHFLAKTDRGVDTVDHDLMYVLKKKNSERDVLFKGGDETEIAQDLMNRVIARHQKETK